MHVSNADFKCLSRLIYQKVGIKIPESKKTMLIGRLSKRLKALKLSTMREYCEYLFTPEGRQLEHVHFLDVVTTNKTDFYREPNHFEFLSASLLPQWQDSIDENRKFNIWSAGCSTGEEPYTMAMVLNEYAEATTRQSFDYQIIATDISTRVLDHAKKAIYHSDRIEPIPTPIRKKYLQRSKNDTSPLIRIGEQLRNKVRFSRINFMNNSFSLPNKMDAIFCRNVIIYFDKTTQEQLIQKFCHNLQPGGYLFLGHSESIHGFNVPLDQIGPTVYQYNG